MNLRLDGFRGVPPKRLLRGLEVVLVAAIAAEAAHLTWAAVTPLSPAATAPVAVRPPAPVDLTILERFDPFFRRGDESAVQASAGGEAPSGPVLYGVRSGGRGSAILAIGGGAQQIYEVGDEVAPGLVLAGVGADHVILSRGGAKQKLGFPVLAGGAAPPPYVPALAPAVAPEGAVDPKRLLAETSLLPRLQDGQPNGYQVMAPAASPALQAAGLQRGDVLLAVDGVGLTPERVAELPQTLASNPEVELRFERAGQVMTKRVRMEPR
ncbi:type II secretion system protein N [Phenylobacterium terrae]|uniref:Type II secretion system protein N n=1 Tax=Phenylobacterium terrae TaxID=2665495 RepID=A0ABW4N572_9CAUL